MVILTLQIKISTDKFRQKRRFEGLGVTIFEWTRADDGNKHARTWDQKLTWPLILTEEILYISLLHKIILVSYNFVGEQINLKIMKNIWCHIQFKTNKTKI